MLDFQNIAIDELLVANEGKHLQFKEAKSRFSLEEALKCCCALSNGGGGILVKEPKVENKINSVGVTSNARWVVNV